jgi:SAM-dependent methyltransferase
VPVRNASEQDGRTVTDKPATVHPYARRGFGLAAEAYRRARPTYPTAAIDWLAEALALVPRRTVLEVGAGTGKFTEQLIGTGATIVAVEPVAEMRAAFVGALPDIAVIDAAAEALPLTDSSVDAIVAAQAFHWFDTGPALAEFHRVLRPGGRLGLVWNIRDTEVDWVRELQAIIDDYASAAPYHEDWRALLDDNRLFGPVVSAEFGLIQQLDHAGLRDRIASMSFIASLDDDDRESALDRVAALVASHPQTAGRSIIELPYRTRAHWTARIDRA